MERTKGKESEISRVKFMRKLACKLIADKCRVQLVKSSPFDLSPPTPSFSFSSSSSATVSLFRHFRSCASSTHLSSCPPRLGLSIVHLYFRLFQFFLSSSLFSMSKICGELLGYSYNPCTRKLANMCARARVD